MCTNHDDVCKSNIPPGKNIFKFCSGKTNPREVDSRLLHPWIRGHFHRVNEEKDLSAYKVNIVIQTIVKAISVSTQVRKHIFFVANFCYKQCYVINTCIFAQQSEKAVELQQTEKFLARENGKDKNKNLL